MAALEPLRELIAPALLEVLELSSADAPGLRRQRRAVELVARMNLGRACPGLMALHDAADPALRLAAVDALDRIDGTDMSHLAPFVGDALIGVALRALAAMRRHGLVRVRDVVAELARQPGWRSSHGRWWRAARLLVVERCVRARGRNHMAGSA
jgi:hypothetical protein